MSELFTNEQLAGRVPDTGWRPPAVFPRLEAAKQISIDCETKDPNMLTDGPGEIRNDGHVVGLAVGVETGERWYFPMRHEFGSGNMNPEVVLRWARDELSRAHQPKIGANLMYDLSWLRRENVIVKGDFIDVQYAEAVINENRQSYALEALAQHWLKEGKTDDLLYEWLQKTYGGPTGRKQAGNIYRSPTTLCGPYAEGDVDLPLRIWELQKKELEAQGLMDLMQMEFDLIPLLLDMRWKGVRVDVEGAVRLRDQLKARQLEAQKMLDKASGIKGCPSMGDGVAKAFDAAGITYPITPAGNPSFQKPWLESIADEEPLAKAILDVRRYDKAIGTFIEGYVLGNAINGRIHAQFHPLRKDENGTVSGRFSSSGPNLQNLPSRDPELGPLIRALFIPDEGHPYWRRYDYSQIEYRLLAHVARGPGADEIRDRFRRDPKTDYHAATGELIHELTGKELGRKPTKNINFGLVYGMSPAKLAYSLGLQESEAAPLFEAYHEGAPFVKNTFDMAVTAAKNRGYVTTELGRRRRFDFWEPGGYMSQEDRDKITPARSKEEAIEKWGSNVQRAGTHAALNSVLQGGSADMMKKAMVNAYKAGIFDVTGVPLVTVHDELDHTDDGSQAAAEAFDALKETMENAIKLSVPVLVEGERGPDWGHMEAME